MQVRPQDQIWYRHEDFLSGKSNGSESTKKVVDSIRKKMFSLCES